MDTGDNFVDVEVGIGFVYGIEDATDVLAGADLDGEFQTGFSFDFIEEKDIGGIGGSDDKSAGLHAQGYNTVGLDEGAVQPGESVRVDGFSFDADEFEFVLLGDATEEVLLADGPHFEEDFSESFSRGGAVDGAGLFELFKGDAAQLAEEVLEINLGVRGHLFVGLPEVAQFAGAGCVRSVSAVGSVGGTADLLV